MLHSMFACFARVRSCVYLHVSISLYNSVNGGYNDALLVSNGYLKYVNAYDKSDIKLLILRSVYHVMSCIHKGFYIIIRRYVAV